MPDDEHAADAAWLRELEPGGAMAWLEEPVALLGGIACSVRPAADALVTEVLRAAVADVVSTAMGVDLTWTVTVEQRGTDRAGAGDGADARQAAAGAGQAEGAQAFGVTRPVGTADPAGPAGPEGLDWSLLAPLPADVRRVRLDAFCTSMLEHLDHPQARPVSVHAALPGRRDAPDRPPGLSVAVSMHRWAMYGAGADLAPFADRLTGWLLGAAERVGAGTGFVTLDRVDAAREQSPWEEVVDVEPADRDLSRHLWGHGWGTLLAPEHLGRLGGVAALTSSGLGRAVELEDGRLWFTLSDRDPAHLVACGDDHDVVAALTAALLPVLPPGRRTLEEYLDDPLPPGQVRRHYIL